MKFLYNILKKIGVWAVACFAWIVATGYFFFLPSRLAVSLRFYRALFPARGLGSRLMLAWRQYHNFASLFAERLGLEQGRRLRIDSEGWEHLQEAHERKTGGVLVMSHAGNWEVAARVLRRREIGILLYMGAKPGEAIEGLQKSDLRDEDVEVVAERDGTNSPLDALEGLRVLRRGGFISMSGDRPGDRDQRCFDVEFAGRKAVVPQAPYLFAALSGAPIFFFFAFRTGRRRYWIRSTPPIHVPATPRAERSRRMQECAQAYARELEGMVRRHPGQWYHFAPFLEEV